MPLFPTITETDLINEKVRLNSAVSVSEILRDLIDKDVISEGKKWMQTGTKYYAGENDISKRIQTYTWDGRKVQDNDVPNVKKNHGFLTILIDQKVGYVAGNPVIVASEDDNFQTVLDEHLGKRFQRTLNDLLTGTSQKGREFLHPYIDDEGNFAYRVLPAEQFILIYDTRFEDELKYALRYYPMTEKTGLGERTYYKAEWWDAEKITFFTQGKNDEFELDPGEFPNPRYHFYRQNEAISQEETGEGWGRIPLIDFKNNRDCVPDVKRVKALIDDYDLTASDFSNNLLSLQDALLVLRGYAGTDPEELRSAIKVRKVVQVDEDGGGVELVSMEIPIEAREANMNRLEQDIFTFGMGVNFKTDKFGANPSGVALKFLYGNLDMKADKLISETKTAIEQLIWFIAAYEEITNQSVYDPDQVEVIFNKATIINEAELIANLRASVGLISDETIIENHPLVTDKEQEIERMKMQKEQQANEVTLGGEV